MIYSFLFILGGKISTGKTKDSTLLNDRLRQIAILLEVMVLQHEREMNGLTKGQLAEKIALVEKTIVPVRKSVIGGIKKF